MILQCLKRVAFSTKITKIQKQKTLSKGINPTQRTQLQRLEKQKQLAQMKQKQSIYLALDSFPSDSIQTISQRFKRIKKNLMNRRIYIPNRSEELSRLDQKMIKLKQFHSLQTVASLDPLRKRTDTKQQIIEHELNNQRLQNYIGLLSNDSFIVFVLSAMIMIITGMQYYFFVYNPPKVRKFPNPTL